MIPYLARSNDRELGATELYCAVAGGQLPAGLPHVDPSYYLTLAAQCANAYITGPDDGADSLNLYVLLRCQVYFVPVNVRAGANVLLCVTSHTYTSYTTTGESSGEVIRYGPTVASLSTARFGRPCLGR